MASTGAASAPDVSAEVANETMQNIQIHVQFQDQEGKSAQVQSDVRAGVDPVVLVPRKPKSAWTKPVPKSSFVKSKPKPNVIPMPKAKVQPRPKVQPVIGKRTPMVIGRMPKSEEEARRRVANSSGSGVIGRDRILPIGASGMATDGSAGFASGSSGVMPHASAPPGMSDVWMTQKSKILPIGASGMATQKSKILPIGASGMATGVATKQRRDTTCCNPTGVW